ncbi:hypothetical protein ACN4EG_21325 [Alkalinema pantanalense CENA528]|uniref:hypothetical protein n=1 Tax=Alkalinema pantanalense TaxID=1620705 RepID=UPI003D6E5074
MYSNHKLIWYHPPLQGWIAEYSAQGMEGEVWRIFQDGQAAQSREAGWQLTGMHRLQTGQELTILAEDGAVLWTGPIEPIRVGWFRWRRIFPDDPDWAPPGIPLAQWASWFRASPPLAAILKYPDSAVNSK